MMGDAPNNPEGVEQKKEDYSFELQFYEALYRREKKDPRLIEILGHLYTREGRVDDGLKMDRRLVRLKPGDPLAHYNLACSLALKERKRDAVASLRTAIDLGYGDYQWMRKDPDLKGLHDYQAFLELLDEVD